MNTSQRRIIRSNGTITTTSPCLFEQLLCLCLLMGFFFGYQRAKAFRQPVGGMHSRRQHKKPLDQAVPSRERKEHSEVACVACGACLYFLLTCIAGLSYEDSTTGSGGGSFFFFYVSSASRVSFTMGI